MRLIPRSNVIVMKSIEKSLRAAAVATLFTAACLAQSQAVSQTNLVANGGGAQISDPSLVNPWGMAYSPTSGFWSANNGTGTATIYNVNPTTDLTTKVGLTVSIPGAGNPTGQVYNPGTGFNGDRFLFVSEDGTVSGWRGALGTIAEVLATGQSSNVYKGSAFSDQGGHGYLYAANFFTGQIDVLKATWEPQIWRDHSSTQTFHRASRRSTSRTSAASCT